MKNIFWVGGELTFARSANNSMQLLDQVKKLYEDNHKTGELRGVHYDYTCPSPKNYPHQFLWDSCFHAIVLTHFDIERAKIEIKTLFANQKPDGFVPCVTIWRYRHPLEKLFYATNITQPPVSPISVEIIYQRSHDKNFLHEIYPKLKSFMDWFNKNRDTNGNGLIEIIHPWETGIDSTPTFDRQLGVKSLKPTFAEVIIKFNRLLYLKTFRGENILMNSIYAKALKSMSDIATELGKKDDRKIFENRYKKVLSSLIKYSWSERDCIFYDLNSNGKQVKIKTISSLMPLILDDLPKKYVASLITHLTNKNEFWSEYPIPSVSMDEPTFSPSGGLVLWRGPTWVNTNWFLSKALIHWSHKKEAKTISDKTLNMIEKNGFWEFYNPLIGKSYGQLDFGWSALVLDML